VDCACTEVAKAVIKMTAVKMMFLFNCPLFRFFQPRSDIFVKAFFKTVIGICSLYSKCRR
jgi:hypothetical protein